MKLAIYDFDGTYVLTQTLTFLFKLWKKKHINDQAYKKYWRKIVWRYSLHKLHLFGWDKQTFRANAMEVTADLFRSVKRDILDQFLDLFYQEIQPNISSTMKKQLKEDNKNGFYTVLLSGNYDIILKPFLAEGFNEVIGSKIEGESGLIASSKVEIIIHQKKQDIIKKRFPKADFASSKAYADSDYDLPILNFVGHPIAVNPDKILTDIARKKNYEIMYIDIEKV